jgi:FkbH-like protein
VSERCLLVSDFNVQNLAGCLEADAAAPDIEAQVAPAGPVQQTLLDAGLPCWKQAPGCAVVWTRPEAVVPAFADVLAFRGASRAELLRQVETFAAAVRAAAGRARCVFVATWVAPQRGRGLLDLKVEDGVAGALLRMNARLCDALEAAGNVFVLDAARWMSEAGRAAASPRLWFRGKVPFAPAVFAAAARDVRAGLRALRGEARKLLVLDLDDTLWGGTVGETGWPALRLGGHDPVGEAFAAFQDALLALTRRGVVLGIASKNDEAVALEAIDRHPEMRLRREHFAGWRIDWRDKARNVAELAAALRLGLHSVVFVDNSAAERARVSEALPEVLVPEWPEDPLLYAAALQALDCFDTAVSSAEDSRRAALYAAERRREERLRELDGNLDDWLASLDITVKGEEVDESNLLRTLQLLNKTSQMNLSTRRLTEAELRAFTAGGNRAWAFRVRDRFGDAGLTGIASLSVQGGRAQVVDFVLSCRVMGRRVEEAMLAFLVRRAREAGAREIAATCVPTPRNGPCLDFWRRSGFASADGLRFTWDTSAEYPLPQALAFVAPPPAPAACTA